MNTSATISTFFFLSPFICYWVATLSPVKKQTSLSLRALSIICSVVITNLAKYFHRKPETNRSQIPQPLSL